MHIDISCINEGRTDTVCQTTASGSVGQLESEKNLKRKPASEQVRFTEYVISGIDLVTDLVSIPISLK